MEEQSNKKKNHWIQTKTDNAIKKINQEIYKRNISGGCYWFKHINNDRAYKKRASWQQWLNGKFFEINWIRIKVLSGRKEKEFVNSILNPI